MPALALEDRVGKVEDKIEDKIFPILDSLNEKTGKLGIDLVVLSKDMASLSRDTHKLQTSIDDHANQSKLNMDSIRVHLDKISENHVSERVSKVRLEDRVMAVEKTLEESKARRTMLWKTALGVLGTVIAAVMLILFGLK